jgi:hypothetical protein
MLERNAPLAVVILALGCASPQPGEERVTPVPGIEQGTKIYAPVGPGDQLDPIVDPEYHMAAARRAYQAGIRLAASREIEKLTVFMGYERDRAAGDRRRAIETSRLELDELARRIGRGEIETVDHIDQAFARARSALRR